MSLKKNEGGIKSGDVVYLQTNKTRKQPNAHLKNENSGISLFCNLSDKKKIYSNYSAIYKTNS